MSQGGIPVARILGIEIRISLAWVVLLAIVTVIGVEEAAFATPTLDPIVEWLIGALVAGMFLISVVAHELCHALVGRRRGVQVASILLGLLGGLAPLSIQAARPRDELVIAVAGPILSLVVGVVLTGVGLAVGGATGTLAPVGGGLLVVGVLNGVLGTLSLIPAMPLDGGRALRVVLWAWAGDPDRAGVYTAQIGRVVGWIVIGLGIAAAFAELVTEGIVLLALGWMLTTGARTIDRRTAMEHLLRGVHVEDAMERDVGWVGPQLTVDTFADRLQGPDALPAIPVVDGETVVGVVGRRRLARLGRRQLGGVRAGDVMASPPATPLLAPDDPLWDALEALSNNGLDALVVAEHGRLAGLLTRDGVAAAIHRAAALRAAGAGTGSGR
jgi:Zn-dependent protease/CBS domain-containing protein